MRVNVSGSGPDLVLLHGWGMNAEVWTDVAARLAGQYRVHSVDLPGYGGSDASSPYTLDAMVAVLARACPPRAALCGWSMGGQLALRWAMMKPHQVERLVLIASTPRFTCTSGWASGMAPAVLGAYAQALARDPRAALQRFALLQAQGDDNARKVARRLRACVGACDVAGVAALAGGLQILRDTDLRADLPGVMQSVLLVHGDRDAVAPLAAGEFMQRTLPRARLDVVAGAAHAPFIAQPQQVAQRIAEFCDG
jgi:pimeloyl-[acyl-carrier protein] methyl ester esterase